MIQLDESNCLARKQDGKMWIYSSGGALILRLSKDDLRKLYYSILNLRQPEDTLQETIDRTHPEAFVCVDVPEDILRAEKVHGIRKIRDYIASLNKSLGTIQFKNP